jgi:hypothetical protein
MRSTGWQPHTVRGFLAVPARATVSVGPPAGYGTTTFMA